MSNIKHRIWVGFPTNDTIDGGIVNLFGILDQNGNRILDQEHNYILNQNG